MPSPCPVLSDCPFPELAGDVPSSVWLLHDPVTDRYACYDAGEAGSGIAAFAHAALALGFLAHAKWAPGCKLEFRLLEATFDQSRETARRKGQKAVVVFGLDPDRMVVYWV